ncbi:MAG TPA: glycosyltransferase family 39 protein [Acidobacteriaceae bacterium]|jgi:uncharacterized membrane protein
MLPESPARQDRVPAGWLAALAIAVTTVCSLVLSHVRMMWADEFLSYWGDRLPTAGDVLRVQLHYPISLDPPTYHLLAHWSMQIFGQGALGMRMPALLGVILAQITLFFLVRRMAGPRAAVIAAALPAALGPFWYSAEGRPYGWLLGMYGLALLCWHIAAYPDADSNGARKNLRALALVGLVLAIAGAITSHYFGVLILLPLAAGELARTFERKRLDFAMVAALAAGMASIALILPFRAALKVFQLHYYNRDVTLQAIKLGYTNVISQSVAATCLIVLVVAVAGYLRFRKRERTEAAATWVMLLTLALMPVWCFLFERFVTHSMEGRYAIPAVLAFVVVIAVLLQGLLQRAAVFYGVLGLVVLAGVGSLGVKIRREKRFRADFTSELTLPALAESSGAGDASRPIYINSFGDFLQDQYYASPEIQSRLTYVFDPEEEIRWKGRDTHSISGMNVQNYAPLHIAPYSEFLSQKNPLVLVYNVEDWEWLPQDVAARHFAVQPLGTMMLGKLEQVDTHPSGMAAAQGSR